MKSRAFLLVCAIVCALIPGISHAAGYSIKAIDFEFQDSAPQLAAGTVITWKNESYATYDIHNVTAYYGAGFASGALNPNDTFQATYPGGTVLYRCRYHSTLDASVTPPRCSGMCASLQPNTPDTSPPSATITTPDGFVFNGGVRIDGFAADNRAVKSVNITFTPLVVAPPVLPQKTDVASCTACGQLSVTFYGIVNPIATLPPSLPPGRYTVTATAYDAALNAGVSPSITIYVVE